MPNSLPHDPLFTDEVYVLAVLLVSPLHSLFTHWEKSATGGYLWPVLWCKGIIVPPEIKIICCRTLSQTMDVVSCYR